MIRYEIPEDESDKMGINYGVKQTKEERIIHRPIGFMDRKRKNFKSGFPTEKLYGYHRDRRF